jgi:hypothetical protein
VFVEEDKNLRGKFGRGNVLIILGRWIHENTVDIYGVVFALRLRQGKQKARVICPQR